MAALPIEMMTLSLRLADERLTAGARMLENMVPAAKPGPDSK
jgi:hypothetical protein